MREALPDVDPLVLTLAFDARAQAWLETLRRAHFPADRNLVPAHVTLFHALPGARADDIRTVLLAECAGVAPSDVLLGPPRLLGRGVALAVDSPAVAALRARLAACWSIWLTPQDRQRWTPHATVQNKVSPERARALHRVLAATLSPVEARAEGLLLWHYRGGPWEPAGRFAFAGGQDGGPEPR